jgi:GNAT superfamily N-acetyltransferase
MERREWGDQAFDEAYFRERLADPAAVVVVLRTAAGRVAGFQIAVADGDSLYVEDTLIAKPHRGKGYVAMLARALEREARRRGYRFVTRDAAIANGYADAIERAYGNRIVERYDHPSEYGPQRYFKIALARSAIDARRPPRP